jgi:hypothetical protein
MDERKIKFVMTDGSSKEITISKCTRLNGDFNILHFDMLKNGTFRITFSTDIIKDISKLDKIEMIRG